MLSEMRMCCLQRRPQCQRVCRRCSLPRSHLASPVFSRALSPLDSRARSHLGSRLLNHPDSQRRNRPLSPRMHLPCSPPSSQREDLLYSLLVRPPLNLLADPLGNHQASQVQFRLCNHPRSPLLTQPHSLPNNHQHVRRLSQASNLPASPHKSPQGSRRRLPAVSPHHRRPRRCLAPTPLLRQRACLRRNRALSRASNRRARQLQSPQASQV